MDLFSINWIEYSCYFRHNLWVKDFFIYNDSRLTHISVAIFFLATSLKKFSEIQDIGTHGLIYHPDLLYLCQDFWNQCITYFFTLLLNYNFLHIHFPHFKVFAPENVLIFHSETLVLICNLISLVPWWSSFAVKLMQRFKQAKTIICMTKNNDNQPSILKQ